MTDHISQTGKKVASPPLPAPAGSVSRAIAELRAIQAVLGEFLRRGREAMQRDMVEVIPGVWIHKDFKDLSDAMKWLNSMIPNASSQSRREKEEK